MMAVVLLVLWGALVFVQCHLQVLEVRARAARGFISVGLVPLGVEQLQRAALGHLARSGLSQGAGAAGDDGAVAADLAKAVGEAISKAMAAAPEPGDGDEGALKQAAQKAVAEAAGSALREAAAQARRAPPGEGPGAENAAAQALGKAVEEAVAQAVEAAANEGTDVDGALKVAVEAALKEEAAAALSRAAAGVPREPVPAGSEERHQRQYAALMAEAAQAFLALDRPEEAGTLTLSVFDVFGIPADVSKIGADAFRKLNPGDELVATRAKVLRAVGRASEAKKLLEAFTAANGSQAAWSYDQLARILAADEATRAQAEAAWRRSLEIDGDRCETHLALAKFHKDEGPQTAVEHARQALEHARDVNQVAQAISAIRDAGGDPPNALVATLAGTLKMYSGLCVFLGLLLVWLFSPALGTLALKPFPVAAARLLLRLSKRDEGSFAVYERALAAAPDEAPLRRAVADAYWRARKNSDRCLELHGGLWRSDADDGETLARFAEASLLRQATDPDAMAAYERWFHTCQDAQHLQEMASLLAQFYLKATQEAPEAALPILAAALEHNPTDDKLQKFLGGLYHQHGHNEEAIKYLLPLAQDERRDEQVIITLARALVGAGQFYSAYRHLRDLPTSEETTSALYIAGVGCDQQGSRCQAQRILQEVAAREPGFADVQHRLSALAQLPEERRWGAYTFEKDEAELQTHRLVWATDQSGERVLLAIFKHEFSDALAFPRFLDSHLKALAQVKHDAIADVLDWGSADETFYVAHRLSSAVSVGEALAEREAFSLQDGCAIMADVLRALSAAHSAGFLHGDLGPHHVFVRADQGLSVVGFGYAAVAYAAAPGERRAAVGNPFYASPEFVRKEPLTAASDIYSAGCLLYHLLVGRPPFQATSRLATMLEHVTQEADPPSHVRKSLYPDVDGVVMRALSKAPADRHASAEELREAIMACAGLAPGRQRIELSTERVEDTTPTTTLQEHWWQSFDNVEPISTARFARVFRGVDRKEREARCIKELSIPETGRDPDRETKAQLALNLGRLFQNEIHLLTHIAGNVRKPEGVVQIHEIWPGDAERPPAYSMELLEGTLEDWLAEQEPLDIVRTLELCVDIAERVAELHGTGVVHRNLTPHSLMFARDGGVRMVGFDRACRMVDHDALLTTETAIQALVTVPSQSLGRPAYLSPEQCRTEPFDLRTDVYSLACVIYRVVAGRPPFVNDDPMALMLSHLAEKPAPLSQLSQRVPSLLDDMLARALAKSPDDRLPNVQEFVEALKKALDRAGRAR